MLFSEMIQEVKNIVQDPTFDASIPGYINDAFLQASARVNIPDLKRIGHATTVTGQMFTSLAGLPNGFSGRLAKLTNPDLLQFRTIEEMVTHVVDSSRAIDEEGPVEMVALEGQVLWYFPTPVPIENITAVLFTNPAKMTDDDDSPEAFHEICHRNIGIHGAAYLCYLIIEDGIPGDKVNTNFHFSRFEAGIQQLVEWVGRHRVHMITSALNEENPATSTWPSNLVRWYNATR